MEKQFITDDMIKKGLGKRIKYLREKERLSQKQLADLAGISEQLLYVIENEEAFVSSEVIEKICNCLYIDPFCLINNNSKKPDLNKLAEKISELSLERQQYINYVVSECLAIEQLSFE